VSSYALFSGSLPSGVIVNSDGTITGTPADKTAGTYNYVVSATGDGGTIYTETLALTVLDDGGTAQVYNSDSEEWEVADVYVYDESGSTWVEVEVYIYNEDTETWDKSSGQ
jgi:hypothetical protein